MKQIELSKLYTLSQVAALLDISKSNVFSKVQQNDIQAQKANNTYVIVGSELKRALEATKVVPVIKTSNQFEYV